MLSDLTGNTQIYKPLDEKTLLEAIEKVYEAQRKQMERKSKPTKEQIEYINNIMEIANCVSFLTKGG